MGTGEHGGFGYTKESGKSKIFTRGSPEPFIEFLNVYGHGGIGFEILGIGCDGSMTFLEEALEYREDGLPSNLIVIENCDEWLYCIDGDSGEVVSWYFDDDPSVDYPSFDDYLIDRLNDAIENLQQ